MLKVPVLLCILGSASLWVLAEGASTARPEDDIITPGASKYREYNTQAHRGPADPRKHRLRPRKSQSTTAPDVVTGHSVEKTDGETHTTVEKDGLATATLIGTIIGVLVSICLIGGIIFVVVRKMSGRYSP